MQSKIQEIVEKYSLMPHPEGGFYKETYRSGQQVSLNGENHIAGTVIFYFLRSFKITGDFSAWHKLKNLDETWFFHEGNDLTVYIMDSNGHITTRILGKDADFQVHVPADTWFSAAVEIDEPEAFSLVSCSVFPGFDFQYFELADSDSLIEKYPKNKGLIEKFTRE